MGEQNEYLCDLDGIIWNRIGTQNSKNSHDPSPSPSPKEILGLLGACCSTSLAARNFYFTHVNYHFSVMNHV